MSNEPRLLFVVNSLSGGGAEKSSRLVFNELVKHCLNLQLIALNQTVGEKILKGVREIELERNWKDGFASTIKNYLSFVKKVKEFKPSIIVAHCELPELYVAFLPFMHIKVVVVEHTSNPWKDRRLIGRLVRILLRARGTTWVSVVSGGESIWFGSKLPMVILNPVVRSEKDAYTRIEERFIFIGRLRKEKRPDMAINAVIGNGQAIGLIGDGEIAEKLRQEYLSVSDKVEFYGFIDNPWNRLHEDSLIIMPSEYEGDGLVAVEAIINGFPILLSDNVDLRRFDLPSKHYFETPDDLNKKIALALEVGSSYFAPTLDKQKEVQSQRNLQEIALQWLSLFKSLTQSM
jgi:glycosyltransferase involved in cell wall biosynthesis